jgi:hypothetical protein
MSQELKNMIKGTIEDSVANFFYYNRKEDEELPVGKIEMAVKEGVLTKEEILEHFRIHVTAALS